MAVPKLFGFYYHNLVLKSTAKIFGCKNHSSNFILIISPYFVLNHGWNCIPLFHYTPLICASNYGHTEVVLLSQNKHVRISDFGLAKEEDLTISQSKGVGTLRFMAPELFEVDEDNEQIQKYTNKVDVYSFGIILIYIVTEKYPTYNLRNILNGVLPKLPSTVVPWVVELVLRCLQSPPNNRPTFNEIFEILKSHDFDLFNETNSAKPTPKQTKSRQEIEHRILKIAAFQYQHTH